MFKYLLILSIFISFQSLADSPITSTSFYKPYLDIPEVKIANERKELNAKLCSFLYDEKNSIDKKIALVNALGWDFDGQNNLELFQDFLKDKLSKDKIVYSELTSDQHLICAYLMMMDDYFSSIEPLKIANDALNRNPSSYTYNVVYGLILAQLSQGEVTQDEASFVLEQPEKYLDGFVDLQSSGWCNIYLIFAFIDDNSELKNDFRNAVKQIIFEYVNLYKQQCDDERLKLAPSLNVD